jgi:hypothetical protein
MPDHMTQLGKATRSYKQWVRRENRRRAKLSIESATVDVGFIHGWFIGYERARRELEVVKACRVCGQMFCKGCATTRELETGVCDACGELGDYEAEHMPSKENSL